MTSLAHSRSVLTGLSMLGSIAVFGAVVSVTYQNAADHGDGSAPPLIRVADLPWKLQPDALLENLGSGEHARRGLERLLAEDGDGDAPEAGAPGSPFEPLPVAAPPPPAAASQPLPAAPPASSTARMVDTPPPAPTPPAPISTAASATVAYRVQLLAAPGEAAAERAWGGLRARFGTILASYQLHIEPAKLAAGTVYRVQIGPFATLAAARATCAELERQQATCFVLQVAPRA
jgi:SPOR domain